MTFFKKNCSLKITALMITVIAVNLSSLYANEDKDFYMTDAIRNESRYVVQSLEKTHYNKKPIAQLDSAKFIDNYINDLDGNHLFLLQPQVDEFHAHFNTTMTTFLKQGNIYPAFEIFKAFKNSFQTRISWVLERLNNPFDFSGNDSFIPIRKDLPFPLNEQEANLLWEKRLKFELLSELLSEPVDKKEKKPTIIIREHDDIYLLNNDFRTKIIATLENFQNPFYFSKGGIYIPIKKEFQFGLLLSKPEDEKEKTSENQFALEPINENNINNQKLEEKKATPTFEEELKTAVSNVRKRYERLYKDIDEIDPVEIKEIFLTSLAEMYDPHSSYLSAETLEEFSMVLSNSLVGIGATLAIEDGYCTIKELIAGGPAERSKLLKPNDKILAVAQGDKDFVDIIGMKLKKTVRLIRGPRDTVVRLLIQPADGGLTDKKVVSLTRDEIRLTSNLSEAKLYEVDKDGRTFRIGVIEIPSFYASNDFSPSSNEPSVTRDVEELIHKLQNMGMEGLILDLRYNGGGLLPEAISLTGLFIPIGPVVHVRNAQGQIREYLDTNPSIAWKGPLVILTSKFSASASEIFAGALKSYHRALIVGDPTTHGKGTVQHLSEITKPITLSLWSKGTPKMGATKFTVQKWYLPDGSSTQLKGVPSDIIIPSINEYLPIAEADLPNPLAWDAIQTIPWTDESIENYTDAVNDEILNKLRTLSAERQASMEEFSYLKDIIQNFKKKKDQKIFSLNLIERKEERTIDNKFTKNMEKWLDKLSTKKFTSQDVKLNSAINTSETDTTLKGSLEEESESKNTLAKFDIFKREGLRIMADYIELEQRNNPKKLQSEITLKSN